MWADRLNALLGGAVTEGRAHATDTSVAAGGFMFSKSLRVSSATPEAAAPGSLSGQGRGGTPSTVGVDDGPLNGPVFFSADPSGVNERWERAKACACCGLPSRARCSSTSLRCGAHVTAL
jgi:hypothetical protein